MHNIASYTIFSFFDTAISSIRGHTLNIYIGGNKNMGRKIFISYKYADSQVKALTNDLFDATTARNYVDVIQDSLSSEDHINKGEADNEDLSEFKNSTIESKLRNKIYDSSVTLVLVSKGMKSTYEAEDDQWIPWEISYSLRESTRSGITSHSNAILAVVLPDRNGMYDYFIEDNTCSVCKCRILKTNFLFKIMKENMFNIKTPTFSNCSEHKPETIYLGESSYIKSVKWSNFIGNINSYLDIAIAIRDNKENYNIVKKLPNTSISGV